MAMLEFDDTVSRRIEAAYTTPDVVEQRRAIIEMLDLRAGADVLDIGSGPGFLADEMAAAVGPDGSVHGIDPSENMLHLAAGRLPRAGAALVEFGPGEAMCCRSPTARSTRSPRPRCTSTSPTFRVRWPRPTGCCVRADGCSCSTPTGTRSCGIRPTRCGCV